MDLIDIGLYLGYITLVVALGGAVLLPLLHMFKNPSGLVKSGITTGVVLVCFGIAYALSGSEVSPVAQSLGVTAQSSKLIGAGLILFYFALVISVVGLVYSEVSKALK